MEYMLKNVIISLTLYCLIETLFDEWRGKFGNRAALSSSTLAV